MDRRLAWFRHPNALLILVLLAACALRLWHLDRWLPEVYEEATPVVRARDFWGWQTGSFDFNPHFFNYPAFSFYIHFAFQAVAFGVGLVGGQNASLSEFRELLLVDHHWFVLMGRGVTVLFDVGTVAVVYLLGKRLGGWQTGLLAALLLACNNLHVGRSQHVIVDIPLTFFSTLVLLFCCDIAAGGKRADFLKTSLCLGLAVATKYTAALLVVPVAAAALPGLISQTTRRIVLQRLALGYGVAGVVFLVCNPFLLSSFDTFLTHFALEREHMALGHFGHDTRQATVWFYALALWGAVGVAGIAALVGLAQTVRQQDPFKGILFVWIVCYLSVILTWNMRAEHYLLPVLPALLVAGTLGIEWAVARFKSGWCRGIALAAALGLYILPQSVYLKDHYARVSAPETRVQAKEWIEDHIAPEALIALEHYSYYPDGMSPHYWLVRLPLHTVHPEKVSGCYNYRWYENFDYIILSGYVYQRYRRDPAAFPLQMELYGQLEQHWQLVRHFAPDPRAGPEIAIYRNLATQRPDEKFDMGLYRALDLGSRTEVQKFLNVMGYALKGAGFERRAWDVAQKIGMLERSKGRRKPKP